jgi:hypothetical protein
MSQHREERVMDTASTQHVPNMVPLRNVGGVIPCHKNESNFQTPALIGPQFWTVMVQVDRAWPQAFEGPIVKPAEKCKDKCKNETHRLVRLITDQHCAGVNDRGRYNEPAVVSALRVSAAVGYASVVTA